MTAKFQTPPVLSSLRPSPMNNLFNQPPMTVPLLVLIRLCYSSISGILLPHLSDGSTMSTANDVTSPKWLSKCDIRPTDHQNKLYSRTACNRSQLSNIARDAAIQSHTTRHSQLPECIECNKTIPYTAHPHKLNAYFSLHYPFQFGRSLYHNSPLAHHRQSIQRRPNPSVPTSNLLYQL